MSTDDETFMIITANRLRDGAIVYMRKENGAITWPTALQNATPFASDDIEAALSEARDFESTNQLVSIYSAEVTGNNRPLSARENIRAHGPSIRYGADATMPDFSI